MTFYWNLFKQLRIDYRKLKPFFTIIRPFNTVFVALTIMFGAFFHSQNSGNIYVLFAVLSAVLISAAGYVINDYYDLEIDKINRPNRILPAKKMLPKTAFKYALILFFLGILFGFLTQKIGCIILAIINSVLMFFYAKSLKKKFAIGNLTVAYAAGSSFIFGAISNSNLKNILIVSLVAFLYTLIREIIKDVEDVEGDKKEKSSTLPIILGKRNAAIFTIIPILLIIFILNYFYIFPEFISKKIFLNILNYLVSIPLILMFFSYIYNLDSKYFHKISIFMKIDMLVYLIVAWFI